MLSLVLSLWLVFSGLLQVSGSTTYEQQRVKDQIASLNFTQEPMVSTWTITILSEPDWQDAMIKYNYPNTESAFSLLGRNQTYIREQYLLFPGSDNQRLRQTIAHEAGHLICNCTSESKANEIADVLKGRAKKDSHSEETLRTPHGSDGYAGIPVV